MSETGPLVAVIVPAYNAAWCIEETLASVAGQSYARLRCVVVNDGSTDETVAVAERWVEKDGRFSVISHANGGQALARNRGAAVAKDAEYLLFLDADDFLEPGAVEVLLRELEAHPEVPAAHGYAAAMGKDGVLIANGGLEYVFRHRHCLIDGRVGRNTPSDPTTFYTLTVNNSIVSAGTVLIRRAAFEKVGGFDGNFRHVEDWECWLRLSTLGDLRFVDQQVMRYRMTGVSLSSNQRRQARYIQAARYKAISDPFYTAEQRAFARRAYRAFYRSMTLGRLGAVRASIKGMRWKAAGKETVFAGVNAMFWVMGRPPRFFLPKAGAR
jgi:glycosyltransferase involved in cell wall biosynthesis